MKSLKKKLYFITWAVVIAYGHLFFSQVIFWMVADGHVLTAAIWHMFSIIGFLIYDKLANYIHKKIQPKDKSHKPNFVRRILNAYLGGSSFKTGLYLFYIGILALSAINASDPILFEDVRHFGQFTFTSDYLVSVEYGILILIAVDTFIAHLTKDMNEG